MWNGKYTLVRSQRKTIALYIKDGALQVRSPQRLSIHEIEKIVLSKEKWIRNGLLRSFEKKLSRDSFELKYGDLVTYRGEPCQIVAKQGSRSGYEHKQFFVPPDLSSKQIMSACIKVYKVLAKLDIIQKVNHFAKQMSVKPASVKINSARTRWGSCSMKRNLNFSWRLIMADDDVIDYVVVHELAHLRQMNHSAQFWEIVEQTIPDYQSRRQRLKDLQFKLAKEGWSL